MSEAEKQEPTSSMDETRRKLEELKKKYGVASSESAKPIRTVKPAESKPIQIAPAVEQASGATAVKTAADKYREKSQTAENANAKKSASRPTQNNAKKPSKKKSKKFTLLLAVIALALLTAVSVYFNHFNKNASNSSESEMYADNEEQSVEGQEESSNEDLNSKTEDSGTSKSSSNSNNKSISTGAASSSNGAYDESVSMVSKSDLQGKYFIAIAAVNSKDKAEAQVARYKRLGYENPTYFFIPDVFEGGKSVYKVVLGPYANKSAAESDLPKIQVIRRDAYIDNVNA